MKTLITILAAGLSRRMGSDNKLLMPVGADPRPMIRRVAEQTRASAASRVSVVVGHQADAVRSALNGLSLSYVDNPDYREGLSASVRTAARAAAEDSDVDSLIITLADMPFVETEVYDTLIRHFRQTGGQRIVLPAARGRRGNPVLWPRDCFSELLSVSGDRGGREILRNAGDRLLTVETAGQGIFTDIDNHEQLAACASV